jgi:hypothetical protein
MIEAAQPPILEIVNEYKPRSFCEIGCHEGMSARWFCHNILEYYPRLKYFGYDAFEEVPKSERNGKSIPSEKKIITRLNWLKRKYKHFSYTLIKGYTVDTLTEPVQYGLVYIDGGHSYETVMHDYEKVKKSKIIIFDDYNLPGVEQAVSDIDKGFLLNYNHRKNKKWVIIND